MHSNNSTKKFSEDKIKWAKETFIWPLLAGFIAYSLKGPSSFVIAAVFFGALYILVTASNVEKYVVCGVLVFFQFLNGIFVFLENHVSYGPLHSSPELWIANRLLYVVGLTFFFPPLIEPFLTTEKRRTSAIFLGCSLLFLAFFTLVQERSSEEQHLVECEKIVKSSCVKKEKQMSWYSLGNLIDDAAVGLAAGLLFVVLSKKDDKDQG